MSKQKLIVKVMSVILSSCLLISAQLTGFAAVLPFETQYDYDKADVAWLTDLVIKENMSTVEGMAQRVELIPVPEYPYSETSDSFKKEVSYFTSLYELDVSSVRTGYIYFFEVLNANSELLSGDISDEDIKEYLENHGIKYPSSADSDELIMARALFTAMISGAVGSSAFGDTSLEEALISYLSSLTGMNASSLSQWLPEGSILSLDEYILAASKMTLWSNGYDVNINTPEEEVYRMVAAMTVKEQGITVDSSLPIEQLKFSYMAALLGEKYNVSVNADKLGEALEKDSVAFYILSLIGKQNGLSIREDNTTYEKAFKLVCENTEYFDVKNGDFYADIPLYDVYLKNRCSSLWIYPTAYATNLENYQCLVSVNTVPIKNNYYNEVAIEPYAELQELKITVTVVSSKETSKYTYTIRVHQGTYANVEGDTPVQNPETEVPTYVSSETLVSNVLSSIGVNTIISSVLDRSYMSLPIGLSSVVSIIAPTFGDENKQSNTETITITEENELFISVLDQIGEIADLDIKGISGLEISGEEMKNINNFVTFD